jgi:hypothetical protein
MGFTSFNPSYALRPKDIKRTADELEKLHHELWNFIKTLTPSKDE